MDVTYAEASTTRDTPWALSKLPAFPAVATKLIRLLGHEDVEIGRIADLISLDTALSAEVLRMANSALFRPLSNIENVPHAVAMLGIERVRALAMTVAIMGSYLKGVVSVNLLKRCWRHSLVTAILAERFAAATSIANDSAYAAGLLHDLGRLGLIVSHPAEYENVIAVAEDNAFDVRECELQLFDIDHCEAGRWMAQQWNFPSEFSEVAAHHHVERAGPPWDLMALVRLSCLTATALGHESVRPLQQPTPEELAALVPEPLRPKVRFDFEELREWVEGRLKEIEPGRPA